MVGRIPEYFPENKGAKIVGRPVIPEIAPPSSVPYYRPRSRDHHPSGTDSQCKQAWRQTTVL